MENISLTGEISKRLLKTENLKLRAVEPADIQFIFDLENDPEIWCAGNTIFPFSKYQIEQYVYNTSHDIYTDKQLRLMIDTRGEEGKCIGVVDLFDFDPHHRRAGLGILILAEERNKGNAYEVVEIMKQYAREVLQLHQLYCTVLEGNEASRRLFEKAGFTLTGVRKEWRLLNNQWKDEFVFQYLF
ncbi:MAG: GNAT family N-acetyltransferase [Syntrophothermus sp.]